MLIEVGIILVYVIAMVGIGLYSRKYTKSLKSFMLGGRNAGAWMSAFGFGTTFFSAVIFIGYAGRNGWNFGLWGVLIGIGNALIGTYLAWKFLASKSRAMSAKHKFGTLPEFFEMRYKDGNIRILAAIVIFVFMTPYAASVFSGLSYLFESVFGIDYFWAILLMAAVAGTYLVLGGYVAALIADLVQGIIMLIGVTAMLAALFNAPGIGGFIEGTKTMFLQASQVPLTDFTQPNNLVTLISTILLTSVGTWGLPHMLHKFFAIKDDTAIRHGTTISTIFAVIIGGGAYLTGALAKAYFTVNSQLLPTTGGVVALDKIIPDFLTSALPSILLGLVIVLVLSASVTTLTGVTLVSSSSIAVDLVHKMYPSMTKERALLVTRLLCIAFLAISVLIALTRSPIQTLMSFSWGTISGCFIGPFTLGLYWKNATKAGAWSGMLGGLLVSLFLALISGFDASKAPLFGIAAMATSMLATWLVSLFTKKFPKEHVEMIFNTHNT